MTTLAYSILQTLAYFEQFQRTLSLVELHQYLWVSVADLSTVQKEVVLLKTAGKLVVLHDFIGLSEQSLVTTLRRQDLLLDRREKALTIARHIYKTPGVASVILMNSTAMQTLSLASDIDFLIITEANALYFARTLVVTKLKRLGLMKTAQDHAGKACLGYWLSIDDLRVRQYQAEMHTASYWITSMVPLAGIVGYRAFIRANSWVYEYLPNWKSHTKAHIPERKLRITNYELRGGSIWKMVNALLYPLHKAKIMRDPEFAQSKELVCRPGCLKLHSVDKRTNYGKKMKSILDIYLQND